TALPTSRAALQTIRSRGELPAQWAYMLRDRPAQTQNYSPTRIKAHFVSSFSSARDRAEGGTLDGDALCIAWERSTPDGTHVAAPDPDDEQDRGAQVGEGWAGDHRRPRPLRPRGLEDHRRGRQGAAQVGRRLHAPPHAGPRHDAHPHAERRGALQPRPAPPPPHAPLPPPHPPHPH